MKFCDFDFFSVRPLYSNLDLKFYNLNIVFYLNMISPF